MDNPYIRCPYNPSHQVLRSRIQAHLVRCEKQYPTLEICPFNATHRFPESELQTHVINCPTKLFLYKSDTVSTKTKIASQYYSKSYSDDDNDSLLSPYNPSHEESQSWTQTQELCPFNGTHRSTESELQRHLRNSPSNIVPSKIESEISTKKMIMGPFYKKPCVDLDNNFILNPSQQESQSWNETYKFKSEKNYSPLEICPSKDTHPLKKSEQRHNIDNYPSEMDLNNLENKMSTKPKIAGPFYRNTKPHLDVYNYCWD